MKEFKATKDNTGLSTPKLEWYTNFLRNFKYSNIDNWIWNVEPSLETTLFYLRFIGRISPYQYKSIMGMQGSDIRNFIVTNGFDKIKVYKYDENYSREHKHNSLKDYRLDFVKDYIKYNDMLIAAGQTRPELEISDVDLAMCSNDDIKFEFKSNGFEMSESMNLEEFNDLLRTLIGEFIKRFKGEDVSYIPHDNELIMKELYLELKNRYE